MTIGDEVAEAAVLAMKAHLRSCHFNDEEIQLVLGGKEVNHALINIRDAVNKEEGNSSRKEK